MEKITWKPGALLAPVPLVLITCGTVDTPNILTIAWTGVLNTQPAKTYISVRPERHSYDIIKNSGEFVINLPTSALVRAVDFCGVRSGKDTDKFEKMRLNAVPSTKLECPQLDESPVSLECKVCEIVPLGTHDMFIADIVAVNVAASLINTQGKLCLAKAGLLAYAHGEYFALGKKLGDFGFSVKKKKKKPQYDRKPSSQKNK